MRPALFQTALFVVLLGSVATPRAVADVASRPNFIFVLADDLGYGELGYYGQKLIATPNLDRMAAEGLRFTQFYSGNTVCAPSRTVLLTGLHNGHATVRGNRNPESAGASLEAGEPTVAKVLKAAGYTTGAVGKWGLGTGNNAGHPDLQGFDAFYGFLTHRHAHNHFPDFLWRGRERVPLRNEVRSMSRDPENDPFGVPTKSVEYADDLFAEEALAFVEKNRATPFFLYWAMAVPHANNEATGQYKDGNEVPDYGAYADRPWNMSQRGHAAMVSRMDSHVGRLMTKLRDLKIEERTLVIFSSDNGHHNEGGEGKDDIFDKNGPLHGMKRDLTEGGIRVPTLAWWPGRIQPGRVSGHVAYFGDVLNTAADLADVPAPPDRDGISFLPELLGSGEQRRHPFLYWEFHEGGFSQAVLIEGRWKVIRMKSPGAPAALYDLREDPAESQDCAALHPDLIARAEELFASEHRPAAAWARPRK
jgi:arylsulfatase A-like enzyme